MDKARHFVRILAKSDTYLTRCETCFWKGPERYSITNAYYDRREHLGFNRRNNKIKDLTGASQSSKIGGKEARDA